MIKSRKTILLFLLAAASCLPLAFTACQKSEEVPVYGAEKRYTVEAVSDGGKNYRLEYSYNAGDLAYYFYYLGKVNFVPISAEGTEYYNGQTPIKLSYSAETVTEGHIMEKQEMCIKTSTKMTNKEKHEANLKSTTEFGFLGVKEKIEASYNYINETNTEKSRDTSAKSTYESFNAWKQTNSKTVSYTIGENGEAAGFYRYALFTTCDVYVAIIKDAMDDVFYYEYSSFARPNSFFTAIDYSSDNVFSSKEDAIRLDFDADLIENLPAPGELAEGIVIRDFSERTNTTIGGISIPATVSQEIFIGRKGTTFRMNIVIAPRNTDLKIVLNNMAFVSERSAAGATYICERHGIDGIGEATDIRHTVFITLYGENSITCGVPASGSNYTKTHDTSIAYAANLRTEINAIAADEKNNMAGKAGFDGIALGKNDLVVQGSGKLSVTGGTGGAGGRFNKIIWKENSGTIVHTITDYGTEGAQGGNGISCNTVDFSGATGGNITVTGGTGGTGGSVGSYELFYFFGGNASNPFSGQNGGEGGIALVVGNQGAESAVYKQPAQPITLKAGAGGAGGSGKSGGQNRPDGTAGAAGKQFDRQPV